MPARSWRPNPASHPPTPGRLSGSRWSKPLQASKYLAVSRTDRVRTPRTEVSEDIPAAGPVGMRPYVALSPKRPENAAGMRIEPPPSLPVAMGSRPPATAAAVPPDEPPGVRARFHGLRVVPCSAVEVQLIPPNSLDVVCPASTAPVARRRVTEVSSWSATRSWKILEASVYGHPFTASSSLTPKGTPPKGSAGSATLAAWRARSKSVWLKALRGERPMASIQASSASNGESSLARNASTRPQASPIHGAVIAADRTPPAPDMPPGVRSTDPGLSCHSRARPSS
jgi:hypothetical protein